MHRGILECMPRILRLFGPHADLERGSCPISFSWPQKSPDVSGPAERRRKPLPPLFPSGPGGEQPPVTDTLEPKRLPSGAGCRGTQRGIQGSRASAAAPLPGPLRISQGFALFHLKALAQLLG